MSFPFMTLCGCVCLCFCVCSLGCLPCVRVCVCVCECVCVRARLLTCVVESLNELTQSVVKVVGNLTDELLYGRVGYLYSLVFINQQFGQEKIPMQYIQQVSLGDTNQPLWLPTRQAYFAVLFCAS